MLRKLSFTIPLDPIAWARAGRNENTYFDTQKKNKIDFGLFLNKFKADMFEKGPLLITVTFFIRIPRTRAHLIKENDYHHTRPDCSNYLKFIEDAMKEITVKDDSLFAGTIAWKRYSKNPRLEICIEELPRS